MPQIGLEPIAKRVMARGPNFAALGTTSGTDVGNIASRQIDGLLWPLALLEASLF
jgi:hypothetical protein